VSDLDVTPVPGRPNLLLGAFDLATLGYRAEEFFVSGCASSYAPVADFGPDGRWNAAPSGTADYTTRIVVLTPTDDAVFNGTVVVEWLNVSGGIDAPAVWFMAHRELVREGCAYVGVSAQRVGVEGGGVTLVANLSLKTIDPERYSRLNHPGDTFCFDIYSQAGRLVREGGVLGGLRPELVLAVGESQSAMFLTTYVNAVDPLAKVYDGFLVHSRFGSAAPLDGATALDRSSEASARPVQFRSDLRVPVVTVITETDLIGDVLSGYHRARQPDNDWLRIWEIPGTAHADNYTIRVGFIDTGSAPLQDIVAAYAPTNSLMREQLSHCINFAPQHHYVVQAAIAGLERWARGGEPAPNADRIALSEANPPQLVLDENGIARGGIRTPWVDVPVAVTSGLASGISNGESVSDESVMSKIFGSGEMFDTATLSRLYPGGSAEYLALFTQALDQAITSGFIVAADRQEILELAAATYPRGQQVQHRVDSTG
jgi:Alpha/beta hydrolase domain